MKKSLIALAVLGAISGAASAQSSVTMYGIVDVGVQYNSYGVNGGTTAAPNWQKQSIWGINGGYQSGNRLGVRGSEALGGNWSAVFDLEMGFNIDTGTSGQNGQLFGRQAYAGLRHTQFGTVAFGRIATASSGTGDFNLWGGIDPFDTGFSLIGLQATFIPSNSLREDNSVIWASPNWGGLQLAASYSANVLGGESAPSGTNTQAYNLSARYSWGPLTVAATYDVLNFPNANAPLATTCIGVSTAGCPDQKMLQLGGTFDFKFLKLHAAWANQDNVSVIGTVPNVNNGFAPNATFIPTGIGNYNNNAYMIGVTVPLFGGNILGSYQWSDAKNIISNNPASFGAQFEPDFNVWGIGYTYPFSRRTNMYVGYGQRSWDGDIRSTSATGGVVLPQASQAFDRNQFAIGLRHLF
ncbi:MAG TPA: porin [Burkholderiaceae bacterium]|nr:porin [Burkholderiaceae bacterium]